MDVFGFINDKEVEVLRLGLDIGGTKIEAVVLSESGEMLYQQRIPTPTKSYVEFLSTVTGFITDIQSTLQQPITIGIGLPGAISPDTKTIKNCNCLILNGQRLDKDIEEKIQQPVFIANDADCFTLSEAKDGAGEGLPTVFGVIIGTGCGGGVVVNGQLLSGPNAIAGEWGHNTLPQYHRDNDGLAQQCYCGKINCIERFISGSGFSERYNQQHGTDYNSLDIMELKRAGNINAEQHYLSFIDMCARSLASVINILDPHVIVLGGGLSNVEEIYQDINDLIGTYVFSDVCNTKIVKAKYGDSSGVRGACWLPKMNGAV